MIGTKPLERSIGRRRGQSARWLKRWRARQAPRALDRSGLPACQRCGATDDRPGDGSRGQRRGDLRCIMIAAISRVRPDAKLWSRPVQRGSARVAATSAPAARCARSRSAVRYIGDIDPFRTQDMDALVAFNDRAVLCVASIGSPWGDCGTDGRLCRRRSAGPSGRRFV
jgi:hypothetical protein